MKVIKCKACGRKKPHKAKQLCASCYCKIHRCQVFIDGKYHYIKGAELKESKKFVKDTKVAIFSDILNNPRKYLDAVEPAKKKKRYPLQKYDSPDI